MVSHDVRRDVSSRRGDMIFTDGEHMISDQSIDELHACAASMGLGPHWFHNRRGRNRPHYDLTSNARLESAIEHGAIGISPRDLTRILREVYGVWREWNG